MSNTRHIANKPLDWEVQPRPFRPGPPGPPIPPPPPPPPPEPPPGYDTQLLGGTVYMAGKPYWTVWTSRVSSACAINFFIIDANDRVLQEVTYWQVRPTVGSVLTFRADCPDWTHPPSYIGGPNHPSPYGNVPEGGKIRIHKVGAIYIIRGYATLAPFRFGYSLYNSCGAIGNIFSGIIWESPEQIMVGSGLYPRKPRTGLVHYHTMRYLDNLGSYEYIKWDPTKQNPDPPEYIAEQIAWLENIPI